LGGATNKKQFYKGKNMNPQVAIIILNWNNWPDTIKCLESVYQLDYPEYMVILVDNGSSDDSLHHIKSHYQGNELLELEEEHLQLRIDPGKYKSTPSSRGLVIIKNSRNYGFTRGNNIGMEFALQNLQTDYLLLLNNDTLVDEQLLNYLVRVGEKHQKIGFIGPKIYHGLGMEKTIQYAGGRQDLWRFEPRPIGYGEKDQGQYDQNRRVDFISGACILARTEMIKKIGLLDEDFFSYREENDWCWRGYRGGWSTWYSYQAVIWHKGQGSTSNQQPTILYYMTRNRFLFMKKHARKMQIFVFLLIFFLYDSWYRTAASIFYHHQFRLVRCFWKAIGDGLKILGK
jgi:hypothetical protein